MKIAVLFDGAGLARLGLERAGHDCIGFELNPIAHKLGTYVGSGRCALADVRDVDLSGFDACWASPPCQWISSARTQGDPLSAYADNLLSWSLGLQHSWPNLKYLWVENVCSQSESLNSWGRKYNAAQFTNPPLQNRNRVIGGCYPEPYVYCPYKRAFADICPCITASEYKGSASDNRRASRFYKRKLTIEECAYHQGFSIPDAWLNIPTGFTRAAWYRELYTAIGNGVPVYMAEAFGLTAKQ